MDEVTAKVVETATKDLSKPVSETAGNLVLPLSKNMGKTFADFWDWILGSHISLAREKQALRQYEMLEKYKEDIKLKVESIPEERLIEASLHVVGPAIEAAKFYVENEELSEMFSNLISAAFDSGKVDRVHPSFTEVIKQMSPLDALNLKLFKLKDLQPICDICIKNIDRGSYTPIFNNYFLGDSSIVDKAELHASSIINLIRLGLVEIEKVQLKDKKEYEKYYKAAFYKGLTESYKHIEDSGIFGTNTRIELNEKVVRLTSFGRDFVDTVIK